MGQKTPSTCLPISLQPSRVAGHAMFQLAGYNIFWLAFKMMLMLEQYLPPIATTQATMGIVQCINARVEPVL
jgi:hypothetical protein